MFLTGVTGDGEPAGLLTDGVTQSSDATEAGSAAVAEMPGQASSVTQW